MACAYAVTAPCAAACAPFKSSPATYATCCKQHAANAPKPKPVAAKAPIVPTGFRTATIKSKLPKPPPTIKLIDDSTSGNNLLTRKLRGLIDDPSPPPTTKSSGGGGIRGSGKPFKEIRCQTGCNNGCGIGGCPSNESTSSIRSQ